MIKKTITIFIVILSLFIAISCSPTLVNLQKIEKKLDQTVVDKNPLYLKYKKQYMTIQLYDVEEYKVDYSEKEGFTVERKLHQRYRIVKGKKFSHKIYVDENAQILSLSARTIKSDGEVINLDMDNIFIEEIQEDTTEDSRTQKTVKYNFQDVDDGVTVELILKIKKSYKTPNYFQRGTNINTSAYPVLFSSLAFNIPSKLVNNEGSTMQTRYATYGDTKFIFNKSEKSVGEEKRTTFGWTAKNLPAFEDEPDMVCDDCHRSWIHFEITPWKNWKEMSKELYNLYFANTFVSSETIKAKAKTLTKGISDEKIKIKRIANFVQSMFSDSYHIIHFYRLQSPESVLRRGYGNDKERGALLVSLLRAAGITAHPAFVRSLYSIPLSTTVMPNSFDDIFVYCKTASGEEIWVDPTLFPSENNAMGGGYQNQKALLITKDGAESLRTTPKTLAKENKADIKVLYTIDSTLKLKTSVEEENSGLWASVSKEYHATSHQNQIARDAANTLKDGYFNGIWGANGGVSKIAPISEKKKSTVTTSFQADIAAFRPSLYEKNEYTLDTTPVKIDRFITCPNIANTTRKYPLDLGTLPFVSTITSEITYPTNLLEVVSLPQKQSIMLGKNGLLFTFVVEEKTPGHIVATLHFEQNATEIAPEKYQEAKKFYNTLNHAFLSQIKFKKK